MNNIIAVIEKRRKIGEIEGTNIEIWELFDVMKFSQLKEWCQDRGYGIPIFTFSTTMTEQKLQLSNDLEVSLWDTSSRA